MTSEASASGLLTTLFAPKAVAVVGASPERTFGGRSVRYLRKFGFQGAVYPVNPNYDEVQGWRCYDSVDQILGTVDSAVIAIRSRAVPDTLRALARKDCRSAVVLSAGFGESGAEGERLQEEIVEVARSANIRLIGPNCNGVVNVWDRIPLGCSTGLERTDLVAGPIALVAQSGSLGASIMDAGMEAGVGFSYVVAMGNGADMGAADYVRLFSQDERTNVVALMLEGIRDGPAFLEALDIAATHGKQVAILKVGRSTGGQEMAASHSGSLAGSWEVFRSLAEGHGAMVVETVEELLTTARLAAQVGTAKGGKGFPFDGVQVVSVSGALCGLMTDELETSGARFAVPSPATVEGLRSLGFDSPWNPLDFAKVPRSESSWNDFAACVRLLLKDASTSCLLFGMGLAHVMNDLTTYLIDEWDATGREKPIGVYLIDGEVSKTTQEMLVRNQVPFSTDLRRLLNALEGIDRRQRRLAFSGDPSGPVSSKGVPPVEIGSGLDEYELKGLLREAGLPVPQEYVSRSAEAAWETAARLQGPCVLKLLSRLPIHKTGSGLVRLNLRERSEVEQAYLDIERSAKELDLWEGRVLVAPMIDTSRGQETLLGMKRDPVFGPVTVVGAGGVWTEIFQDVAFLPSPASAEQVATALKGLAVYPILTGARRRLPLDLEALREVITCFSRFVATLDPSVESLEVNPLVVLPEGEGCQVLDARVVVDSQGG